jgi:hypothetical protein
MKYLLLFLLLLSLSVDATPIGAWELMEPDSEDVKSIITITSVPKDSDRYRMNCRYAAVVQAI